jgi:hypothetical protein
MKNLLIVILLLGMVGTALTACGKDDAANEADFTLTGSTS